MGCCGTSEPGSLKALYAATNQYTSMPVHNWYLQKYGDIANRYGSNCKVKIDDFLKKYNDKILYQDSYFNKEREAGGLYCAIIDMDSKGTIAYVEECFYDPKEEYRKANLNIFYSKETSSLDYAKKYILKNRIKEEKKGIINLICKTQHGFELKEYTIKDPAIDFESNYNHDFKSIDSIILNRLNQEEGKGLVMLYGEPGTGKTSYIRRVINNVNKRVLYLPPDMATELSNPGLMPFLTDIPNSILIVEDAENVLIKRQGQHNQAISNILNLSDGLFGDCLNIQILATFNTSLNNIDEALLRKGRLIAKYEFKKLSSDRVQKLTKKLGIKFGKDSGTLAEIYNCDEMDFQKNNRKEIGFKVSGDNGLVDKTEITKGKKVVAQSKKTPGVYEKGVLVKKFTKSKSTVIGKVIPKNTTEDLTKMNVIMKKIQGINITTKK